MYPDSFFTPHHCSMVIRNNKRRCPVCHNAGSQRQCNDCPFFPALCQNSKKQLTVTYPRVCCTVPKILQCPKTPGRRIPTPARRSTEAEKEASLFLNIFACIDIYVVYPLCICTVGTVVLYKLCCSSFSAK